MTTKEKPRVTSVFSLTTSLAHIQNTASLLALPRYLALEIAPFFFKVDPSCCIEAQLVLWQKK